VVVAKRGDQVVDQQALDYYGREQLQVVLDVS